MIVDQSTNRLNGVHDAKEPVSEFDPKSLAMTQDFGAACGVKVKRNKVGVGRPTKEVFFQVDRRPEYRLQTLLLELKDDNEIYLVHPSLWSELAGEPTVSPRLVLTVVTRQNVVSLWPIRLPGADGKLDDWNRSALDAAREAETNWVRLVSNRNLGAYEAHIATGITTPPDWEKLIEEPFSKLLEIAFKDKFIRDFDHPVLKKLRGEF